MTVGAMQALALTFMVGIDPGDEVLVTDPSYTNFDATITLAGGRAVFVPTDPERGYLPHVEDVAAAITPRTRAILVNSPANPTGAVYPRDLLHAIAELVRPPRPPADLRRDVRGPDVRRHPERQPGVVPRPAGTAPCRSTPSRRSTR